MSGSAPERVFDSGIAEQHLLASAAGLAAAGMHPVVAVYSTFLNRAINQVLLDIALHELPVTLALDRAGVTGPDGPSHHGMWDLALLTCVPGIASPVHGIRDECAICSARLSTRPGPRPCAIRKPLPGMIFRSWPGWTVWTSCIAGEHRPLDAVADLGGADGTGVLAGSGTPGRQRLRRHRRGPALGVADQSGAARHRRAASADRLRGGRHRGQRDRRPSGPDGRARRRHHPVRALGLPTAFIAHDSRDRILAECGLTGEGIAASCLEWLPAAERIR